jgi:hypothetical protein
VVNQQVFAVKNQAIRDIEYQDVGVSLYEAPLPSPRQYKIIERKS